MNAVPQSLLNRAALDPEIGGLVDPYTPRHRVPVECEGQVVGFFTPRRDPDGSARIGAIYILPKYRGRGLAQEAIRRYVETTVGPFRSWISDLNISSQRAFASAGFERAESFGEGHWWTRR